MAGNCCGLLLLLLVLLLVHCGSAAGAVGGRLGVAAAAGTLGPCWQWQALGSCWVLLQLLLPLWPLLVLWLVLVVAGGEVELGRLGRCSNLAW